MPDKKKHTVTYLEVFARVVTEEFDCPADDDESLAKAAHKQIHPQHMYQLEEIDGKPVPIRFKCR